MTPLDKRPVVDELRKHLGKGIRESAIGHPWYWDELLLGLHLSLEEIAPDYKIMQTKSKFGGLRYYTALDGQNEAAMELIRAAEIEADKICTVCGDRLCEVHNIEAQFHPRQWS